jgi:hypothetical protein
LQSLTHRMARVMQNSGGYSEKHDQTLASISSGAHSRAGAVAGRIAST